VTVGKSLGLSEALFYYMKEGNTAYPDSPTDSHIKLLLKLIWKPSSVKPIKQFRIVSKARAALHLSRSHNTKGSIHCILWFLSPHSLAQHKWAQTFVLGQVRYSGVMDKDLRRTSKNSPQIHKIRNY
jgi:hypothetical protein